jgi:hypothetical protein
MAYMLGNHRKRIGTNDVEGRLAYCEARRKLDNSLYHRFERDKKGKLHNILSTSSEYAIASVTEAIFDTLTKTAYSLIAP